MTQRLMTQQLMPRRLLTALMAPVLAAALLLAAPVATAADEAILLIDQTVGVAAVQRDGKRLALSSGAALQEQDLIVTERSGRMTLRLGRHGFVEVGPNAEIGIERLPFAAYARDLKSIFSVGKGYFRVVWKHPQLSSNWPLYVYMAGHRISLSSGEYFFQNQGASQRACVAAGQIALQAAGVEGLETIKPPACVELAENAAPKVVPRNPDDWIAVRRGFSIEATAATLLARETRPPLPAPVAPAKPVITTALVPAAPSVPPPVAVRETPRETPVVAAPVIASGPVVTAPSLPAPAAAPRTAMTPPVAAALPPPATAPAKPAVVTAPLIIGEVQTLPPRAGAPVNTGKTWVLNAASYSESAVATAEAQRLRAAGFTNVITQPAVINGKQWYRVQITGYADEPSARKAALELKNKLGLQNVWVLKP